VCVKSFKHDSQIISSDMLLVSSSISAMQTDPTIQKLLVSLLFKSIMCQTRWLWGQINSVPGISMKDFSSTHH